MIILIVGRDIMINRQISTKILDDIKFGKITIIYGPRQVGKTTLLNQLSERLNMKTIWLNGDEANVRHRLSDSTSSELRNIIADNELIIIDEAQRIKNIGLTLKIMYDNIKGISIIASGSSSFELANEINEPLTGRKFEYDLFPISFQEMIGEEGILETERMMKHRLVYGFYPEVITTLPKQKEILLDIANSYLFKDLLSFDAIKKPSLLDKLLQALAWQVGSEVNYNELSNLLQCNNLTVERYIDLLEKVFVVFRLHSISKNERNEIKKSKKVYFYDNGIRNAVISNFNPVENRNDTGALWENFLISERKKFNSYNDRLINTGFWRTKNHQEIDYIEVDVDKYHAFEFKWNPAAKGKFSKSFTNYYDVVRTETVNHENYIKFITEI